LLDRDGHGPRYPFGFGLSYTAFEVDAERTRSGSVRVTVRNRGDRDGATVVFLFRQEGPARRMVAFRKVQVAAGAAVHVDISPPVEGSLLVAQHAADPAAVRV
jgi:hypothetical protein